MIGNDKFDLILDQFIQMPREFVHKVNKFPWHFQCEIWTVILSDWCSPHPLHRLPSMKFLQTRHPVHSQYPMHCR